MTSGRRPLSREQFEQKIIKDANGCWLWSGAKHVYGYGHLRKDGKLLKTHRVAWEMYRGAIPDGLCILHKCDVPACINPDHLFLGTKTDNNRDRIAKGRTAFGERIATTKLTDDQARAILIDPRTHRAIAADYGVAHTQIGRIKRRQGWRHV